MAKKYYFCHCWKTSINLLKKNNERQLERRYPVCPQTKTASRLNNLNALHTRKKNTIVKLTRNSKIFKTIIHAIQEKKGDNIISLDLRKIPEAVADFFIICEASNPIQLRAIADFVEIEVKKKCLELPFNQEGRQGQQWILIDYVNIVVHVMLPEPRKFYRLEEMWHDAQLSEHSE